MITWAMEHPWMTFFLVSWGITAIGDTICTVAKEIGKSRSRRSERVEPPPLTFDPTEIKERKTVDAFETLGGNARGQ